MIELSGLTKQFGAIPAVSGLDLTVNQGEVLGFLGPNGAGKSTTMKMVTGYLTPDAGTVRVCGYDMATDTIAAQRMIGYLPEGAPAYGDMTPRQFLGFIAEIRGFKGAESKKAVADAVNATELDAVLDQPIETLSKGFKRRVGLAQAILHNPAVLIMDEPTDGLDPNQKHAVRELIRAMAATKAIVVSTHVLEEVEAICTRAVIIDRGRVVADGTPTELLARSRHHNAVTLTLPADQAERAKAKLKALPSVSGIEETVHGDGLVDVTAFPKSESVLAEEISRLIASENWTIKRLNVESGRLDDVFRAITTHDAVRARGDRA